ncbi:aminomethyl-transferring glycine dehydrogenase [Deinococcus radiodurans]|jgi:glycine dehydrogenase (decarboxylating) alpha subunit (EC 1.4.4.2)/glycine dehydrogenase (decarboxylating) beta subunit (EC 1.4.4.2)|uniref:Glycine dehydrogenase (decarboxylating) n=1 Tax=Deinococcus radiodurans (strain ATCC 13939 / DSM 20539 / JCM 16871 / CCUG 27074 / LMG 4051 / NBRC 15346 / NCIMB 9279 / VKM B-1422 / R1) TaxID=243230 RepID=GCSP_DEIRA|nr:aminomethyl-transferring glycine dehydrogenase [Deinococcus radiodurans]Q9RTF5.1 RecName: Full=Glycine dehydrogenase (decarboxylating); AltName: Full=Glycine cleavage system P-protein; AltName: Full=Glycine decarboxylase; AltName: Full=Glycine dehydrogenase (aminomethyl-transferring) [Deinococcus radiodurans R1 = ATCC 13939 = DSM 20539]AAF11360.1 glycine cleavage system P protein [Deinococcus radiodurans R1 = ATCC 13939 = DSM 20539]ANC71096.1 glycine dehydrogenase (aminomethyl-transferring) [
MTKSLSDLLQTNDFTRRHIGPSEAEQAEMLGVLGVSSLDELTQTTLPAAIQFDGELHTGPGMTEAQALAELKAVAQKNKVFRSYIGMGYAGTDVPPVILRNMLENPGWYTAYTPYQAEISQGRLEMLLNFQQTVQDMTGMPVSNASLLDEATAAAEAMTLAKRQSKNKGSNVFFVADNVHPQTMDVVKTRAEYFGFEVQTGSADAIPEGAFGALVQYPGTHGEVLNLAPIAEKAHTQGAALIVATDLLACALLTPPGEQGADIVVGSAQRFGVPMGFGGPHAAFLACQKGFERSMPGRVIGVSKDVRGNTALRMAMQTREQHIRREKATSNICTAQALLANMAAAYAVWHGPEGIKTIAERVHRLTGILAKALQDAGIKANETFFDTLTFEGQDDLGARAEAKGINFRLDGGKVGISLDETVTPQDLADIIEVVTGKGVDVQKLDAEAVDGIPAPLKRQSDFLTHPVFNTHHSEHGMLRYLKQLENKDYSLTHGMIPLGSCTMKLNATTEMIPVTWPEFGGLHPFAPESQTQGYAEMLAELERWLADITGYDAVSMQPNSGAQGEYAGLLVIRKYHEARGEAHRNICLIPASAHGTNPASAAMMGMQVVVVKTDEQGNIDFDDLKAQAEAHSDHLAALMITYPSTHGVYEENVRDVCDLIHQHGGQVYLDGANMNAMVGVAKPGLIGGDVSHLNLHKTFAIPHGGGGPGMGPIGVKAHLAPFLPNHAVAPTSDSHTGAVSAAPYGSASILPISYLYIKLLGAAGLRQSTQVALLNANYIAKRLSGAFPVLYSGKGGRVAHECILDIRPLKQESGVSEEDIAKRLMDYGFHAPTMSFPVPGTLMIEPTESEPKAELDRFVDAMLNIRREIQDVQDGTISAADSPLKHAPHTLKDLMDSEWTRAYSRETGAFPSAAQKAWKYWPAVNRVDNVYGDRNFVCSCPPIEDYIGA